MLMEMTAIKGENIIGVEEKGTIASVMFFSS
jgi:hypothetical protein